MVGPHLPMPLCHITTQTEHATSASARAGNAGKKSLGKECDEEQVERRDHSVVCCLLCMRTIFGGGARIKTQSH